MTFSDLGLSPAIVQSISEKGYTTPTPIQAKGIPAVLSGKDVMAAAQTGTGKTAAFTLPIIEQLLHQERPRANQALALVLAPTRELALQIAENVEAYSQGTRLRSAVVYGGVKINPQMIQLRKGVDILIATPGRLLDLFSQNAVKFNQLRTLVLDEADRMLDMGFIHDIKKIIKVLPKERQNLLFSATFSDPIRDLAKGLIFDPVEISVTPKNTASKTVTQFAYGIDKAQKTKLLSHLIRNNKWQQVLVFCRTKHGANRLVTQLERDKISSAAIHGNKSQSARVKALNGFKTGEISVLVATDIVARGLDIAELPYVVNYDLPNIYEDYVHRIGRTGRAGSEGVAVSFVTQDDAEDLYGIERFIGALIPRAQESGFEPNNPVPEKALDTRPVKPKKAKKPKPQKDHQAIDHNKRQQNPAAKKANPNGANKGKQQRVKSAIDNPTNAKPKRRRFKPKPANT
ncbi:ATP-dependent RNA helicase RhlE [Pseudoalteromonas holothuriae]|uniref:DEAD-box ATP-dependent RNA helicase RhpA n=1 Tax=Pseudoalteromonas holothuriae TaxID=2963714 RepID=A0A9W4R248_9GAMM|nr:MULTISPECIES: DEAD/DEAH box helicase [unclassified Pseudoalteromonas]CAH9063471.1 ATP-dependent RNA helicase RhlE [Pseudoalteromonas sp. CIP111854]CAH9064887.1 ATP-dependent RNA helicase RhlE [Pseudoalteromonas sp. CIP111951]